MNKERETANLWSIVRGSVKDDMTTKARMAIRRGADVNARSKIGVTPIMWAAYECEHILPILLEAGADLAAVDYRGRTVMDWARMSRKNKSKWVLHALSRRGNF